MSSGDVMHSKYSENRWSSSRVACVLRGDARLSHASARAHVSRSDSIRASPNTHHMFGPVTAVVRASAPPSCPGRHDEAGLVGRIRGVKGVGIGSSEKKDLCDVEALFANRNAERREEQSVLWICDKGSSERVPSNLFSIATLQYSPVQAPCRTAAAPRPPPDLSQLRDLQYCRQ